MNLDFCSSMSVPRSSPIDRARDHSFFRPDLNSNGMGGIGESTNPRNQSESKDPEPGASGSTKLNQIKQAKRL